VGGACQETKAIKTHVEWLSKPVALCPSLPIVLCPSLPCEGNCGGKGSFSLLIKRACVCELYRGIGDDYLRLHTWGWSVRRTSAGGSKLSRVIGIMSLIDWWYGL